MTLIERIENDLIQSMRAKDELRLSVLRMMKSAIRYKQIEKMRALDDAETMQVLNTLVKQRRESVEMFGKGGRQDLVEKETKEIAIIEAYLPAGASDADLEGLVEIVAEDKRQNSSHYSFVIASEGAVWKGHTLSLIHI